ncbi:MAG TPA: S-methyl-5-thioribose-1-phosphate isomerase [Bacteroidales bacterium]|nr:S-methyl-5-thioribose-1-phosphate isomerase [Bacteroidales bacterium]
MHFNGKNYRTVWMEKSSVFMIEQNLLPFDFRIYESANFRQTCHAIKTMIVRGAGAIGVTAGYAMAQAFVEGSNTDILKYAADAKKEIEETRPTARNLFYAVARVYNAGINNPPDAIVEAEKLAQEDVDASKRIGELGNELIIDGFGIETHCNAGWLAFTDYGTALSPVYRAAATGKKIFVYVDETRPRSQGARLTAWELKNENIPHVIIPDNAGAYLMSLGKIDMVIVGADRIAANGDVANKIGTLEKAIAAREYKIPFYVAAPTSTFDPDCISGKQIPIEERSPEEILYQTGPDQEGNMHRILVCSPDSPAMNPAFDVTPAKLITKIITEKGIINPDKNDIKKLFST